MSPEQIEVERKAFEAHKPFSASDLKRTRNSYYWNDMQRAWDAWLARAEKAQRVREALLSYMAAFGQGLEANGIPYDKQQQEADAAARAELKD